MHTFISRFVGLVATILVVSAAQAAEYEFASIQQLSEQEVGRLVLPKIYDKLDIPINITPLPGKRAEQDVKSGLKDGEIMRIWSYGEGNDSVIRVPTSYYYLLTTAFVRKGSIIDIKQHSDLAKHRLAKVRGVKHTNDITRGMPTVMDFNSSLQMLSFVSAKRADIALTNYLDGMLTIYKHKLSDKLVPLEGNLARLELYHYVHVKHAELVPRIDNVIRTMKASGELENLVRFAEFSVIEDYSACDEGIDCVFHSIKDLHVNAD